MKIVLINPKINNKYPQPPLGLLSLGTVLKNKGYDTKVLDMNLNGNSLPEADVYGIGVVSLAYDQTKELISRIRNTKSRIIVGGAHPSALPDIVSKELKVDAVVIGEGEDAILEALKTNGVIQMKYKENIDDLPILDYDLLDWGGYHPHPPHGKYPPFMPMVASRGCPFQCNFCSKSVFGKRYRTFSASRIVSELEYLKKKYGIREVAFYDDVFTLDKKRIYELCDLMQKKNLKMAWSCETRVDLVDEDLLKAMKSAGCFSIAYGIESGSKQILDYLCKGIDYWQVYQAIKMTQDVGMETVGYFMFVPQKETPDTIEDTILLAKRLNMDFVQFSKFTPLPGSQIYKIGDKYDSYVSFGKGTNDDIDQAIKRAYHEYYLNLNYIGKRMVKSLKSVNDFKMSVNGLRMLYGG